MIKTTPSDFRLQTSDCIFVKDYILVACRQEILEEIFM